VTECGDNPKRDLAAEMTREDLIDKYFRPAKEV